MHVDKLAATEMMYWFSVGRYYASDNTVNNNASSLQ